MRNFTVSLYYGLHNRYQAKETCRAEYAADAAREALARWYPKDTLLLPMRYEEPGLWSAATAVRGQRIYVREQAD